MHAWYLVRFPGPSTKRDPGTQFFIKLASNQPIQFLSPTLNTR